MTCISQTATTLTFAIYLLAQHPHFLRRLRAEILESIGTENAPTLDDVRNMKFLRAVINGQIVDTVGFNSGILMCRIFRDFTFVSSSVSIQQSYSFHKYSEIKPILARSTGGLLLRRQHCRLPVQEESLSMFLQRRRKYFGIFVNMQLKYYAGSHTQYLSCTGERTSGDQTVRLQTW